MITPNRLQPRRHIRHTIRQRRRLLTDEVQRSEAQRAASRALTFTPLATAQRVALFLSVDGEIDTQPLIKALWQQGRELFLPVLHPFSHGQLLFLRYTPTTALIINRFQIPEPPLDVRTVLPLAQLDALIVPLVAFDAQGQRLGMGGGFYDRTLMHWQRYNFTPIGYAHDCQQMGTLPAERWDIPLPAIVTPSRLWRWP